MKNKGKIEKKDSIQLKSNFSSTAKTKNDSQKTTKVVNINHLEDLRRREITRLILQNTKSF